MTKRRATETRSPEAVTRFEPATSTEPRISIMLAGLSSSVSEARHALAELAGKVDADVFAVATAVSEAVTNSVLHGFDGGDRAGEISIDAGVEGDQLVVAVADNGIGMRPRPTSGGLGLGLPLIGRLTSSYEVASDDHGTAVRMRFALGSDGSERQASRSAGESAQI